MGTVGLGGPGFLARSGLAFRAECAKELAGSSQVETGISRLPLHGSVTITANSQGQFLSRAQFLWAMPSAQREAGRRAYCPERLGMEVRQEQLKTTTHPARDGDGPLTSLQQLRLADGNELD